VGPLQLTVRLDEVATVTVSGKVPARGRRTPYRFRRFERRLEAGRWLPVRLHPARAAVAALRRAVSKQRLVARVKVAAVDRAGNETRRAVQIRLRQ
jgi:hypothetical protein